ncbi:hypothetical protein [Longispora albida]|uniref:hypothetical protein n=1 Tax=Longispora albida TaxID=203523 RepID=UPI00036740A7|nr:hypothetical protein [Longispora albida]
MSADRDEAVRRLDEWQRAVTDPGGQAAIPAAPDSPYLASWLSTQERAFPGWAARYGAGAEWDFSAASTGPLAASVFTNAASGADLLAPGRAEFAECAAWYWGEVLRRTAAPVARWRYTAGERDGHSPFRGHCWVEREDTSASYTPLLNLARMLDLADPHHLGHLLAAWLV